LLTGLGMQRLAAIGEPMAESAGPEIVIRCIFGQRFRANEAANSYE
jgi:hypothetical protein